MTCKESLPSDALQRLLDDWDTITRQPRKEYFALAMNVKSDYQGPIFPKLPQKPAVAFPAQRGHHGKLVHDRLSYVSPGASQS